MESYGSMIDQEQKKKSLFFTDNLDSDLEEFDFQTQDGLLRKDLFPRILEGSRVLFFLSFQLSAYFFGEE